MQGLLNLLNNISIYDEILIIGVLVFIIVVIFVIKKFNFSQKFSLKTKAIIFAALCVIGIIIAVNAGIQNRRSKVDYNHVPESSTKITADKSSKEQDSDKNAAEQAQDQKNKALEDKCTQGYNAFSKKEYSQAISIEDEVIKEDANFYKAYNIKGIALCYSGKFEEGMKNIDKALAIKPDFGYSMFNKALAYELYGHYDEALDWYNKDLQAEKYIWSYYGISSIYGRRGDVANTVKYLKQAIDMSSDIKAIARDEKDFNPVKNSKEFQDLVNK